MKVPEKEQFNCGAFIAADYIEYGSTKLVATTTNNNQIYFWDSNNYIWRERINTSEIQLAIKWCGHNVNKLFTGGVDTVVHAYDVQNFKEVCVNEGYTPGRKDTDNYHDPEKGKIVDLLPIPDLGLIASAGLDYKICLWRMDTLTPKPALLGHTRGVLSLDWYAENHLILSAGLDHDVFIWNPHVQRSIFTLKGHNHSLVGVKWMPGTNQIVSADISGNFRIWDVRTFTTVQSFNCPLNEIQCMAITQPPKRVIAGGRRLVFYDYNEPTGHNLADDEPCICLLYNPVFYTFITAHPKCIKVWNASNGSLLSVFRGITKSEITSICMDERNRKLFVGDQKGRTRCLNIKNGQKMKSFKKKKVPGEVADKEKELISGLKYWGIGAGGDEETTATIKNQIIVTSWDAQLRFFDDDDANTRKGFMLHSSQKHTEQINFVDFKLVESPNMNNKQLQGIIATCGDDGNIFVYNHSSHRIENHLYRDKPVEVKVCKFLADSDCMVSADMDGNINFWALSPHVRRGCLLMQKIDYNKEEMIDKGKFAEQTPIAFPIRGMDYDPEERILYTGDEMGYMHKWDVNDLLEKMDEVTSLHKHQQQMEKQGGNQ